MPIFQLSDVSLGVTVAFDFASKLTKFRFNDSIWLSIARVIIKALDILIISPIKNIVLRIWEIRDEIIIAWEKSKARVQAQKLVEVTYIYEEKKKEVQDSQDFSQEAKQKLIANLDRALDSQVDKIIQFV